MGKEAVDAYAKLVLAGDSLPSITNREMMLLGQRNIPEYAELIADMYWRLEKRRTPTLSHQTTLSSCDEMGAHMIKVWSESNVVIWRRNSIFPSAQRCS